MWSSLIDTKKNDFLSTYTRLKSVSNISFSSCWYDIWLSLVTFEKKSFQHAFTTTWIWSVILRKTHHTRHILKLFFIQMPVSPKVFVPQKRNCNFWKWQILSFKMTYVMYASDENERFYRPKRINFSLPTVRFSL